MDQLTFQKSWIDSLRRLWGEFRDDLKMGELLTLLAVATRGNSTAEELAAYTGIDVHLLKDYLCTLGPPTGRWWQRRHGLIQTENSGQQPQQIHYGMTLKGALVIRTLFLIARLDDQPPSPTESARWRF
ncbi:MAG TPA: hypothetical protein VMH34_02390 [Gammaproteobacteria bacterium]|nr:hypothetical protein [Gammaproteobacteria bacterium]